MTASSAAGTERIDNGVCSAVAEPVPREREALGRNLPESSSRCQLVKLRHLLWAQPARQHVEIVDPQEILRARMMARPVDERQQQRVDVVGGRRRGTEGVNAYPAGPQLLPAETFRQHLQVRDLPMHVERMRDAVSIDPVVMTLIGDEAS